MEEKKSLPEVPESVQRCKEKSLVENELWSFTESLVSDLETCRNENAELRNQLNVLLNEDKSFSHRYLELEEEIAEIRKSNRTLKFKLNAQKLQFKSDTTDIQRNYEMEIKKLEEELRTTKQKFHTKGDLFTILRTFSTKYSIYRLSLGPVDIINIVNPEDMEQILTGYQHMSKSKLYSYFKSWLGTGLLTSTGEKWHNRRKLLTPAFHFMVLQEFLAVFRDETEKVIAKIDETLKDGEIIEIMPIVIQFTLQTIGETAMGLKNIDDSFLNIYKNNVLEMGRIVINRVIRPWCDEDFIYRLTRYYRDEKQVAKRLHHFSRTIIDQKKRTFIQNKPLNCEKKKRLLDILLQAKEDGADIDDDGIREEVDTFMFEGHDTTAAALSLILMLLADNPEHQERVVVEILETVGHHSDLTYAEAQKLPYLERCIKEGLRLYPSVPMISRKAGCDFVTSSGYRIPSGTTLHMHIFDLHRKPNIYPDPNRFDPDRFLKENCIGRHPFAYLPFSAGPRNCIGQKFAMLEMKTFLIGILRKFKMQAITKQSDIVLEPDFVLKTSEPIKIKFSKR